MVNVTMLVRDRPRLTQQALDSLRPTKDRAVTVMDDRSDTETRLILEAEHNKLLHVVRNDIPTGTGELRNQCIHANEAWFGRFNYLYLSDNDVVFTPGWLDTLIDCYESAWSSGCRVLGGVGHPYHQHGETLGICSFNVRYAVQEVLAQPLQSMLMRWEVWDKYGPFTETPVDRVCMSEDVDFTNKLRADGYKLGVVSPALVVSTGITNTFGEKIPGWELVKAQAPAGVIVE